jgi:Ca2+/Na+ antiporter
MLLSQNGAAITTVLSEATVFVFCAWKSRDLLREIDNTKIRRNILHSLVGVFIVICVSFCVHMFQFEKWTSMLVGVGCSMMFYIVFLLIIKNEMVLMAFNTIKSKLKRRI